MLGIPLEPYQYLPNPPFICCDTCDCEIYENETAYQTEDGIICGDCLDELFKEMSRAEKAELIFAEEIIV